MSSPLYGILMIVSVVATIGGVLTLMPASGATYENVLGYRSLCPFAPAATLYCFAIAGTSCVIRASFVKRKALTGKAELRTGPAVVVAVLYALAVFSTFWFLDVKAQYADAESGATMLEYGDEWP